MTLFSLSFFQTQTTHLSPSYLAREGLLRLRLLLLLGTVKHLKEEVNSRTHTDMEVRLRALNVIMHIISKLDELIDGQISLLGGIVSALHKERCIAMSAEVTDTLELGGRVLEVDVDSGRTLDKLAHLSQEHTADNSVIRIVKEDAENDDDTVVVLLEPDRLVGTVVDLNELAITTAGSSLVEHGVENASEHVTGKTRGLGGKGVGFLGVHLLEGNLDGEVVAGLRRGEKRPVHLLDVVHGPVLSKLLPAGEAHAHDNSAAVLVGVEVPHNLVEIGDLNVEELRLIAKQK